MFSGTMIDDLIRMVERTEEHARTETAAAAAPADVQTLQVEVYPEFSTFVYQWQGMEQVIGVA